MRFRTLGAGWMAASLVTLGLGFVAADAQVPPVGPSGCVPGWCGGGSGPPGGGTTGPQGPSREDLERDRVAAMNEANEAGIAAFRRGDWDQAIRHFLRALEFSPHNPDLLYNLNEARREKAAEEQRRRAQALPKPVECPSPGTRGPCPEPPSPVKKPVEPTKPAEPEWLTAFKLGQKYLEEKDFYSAEAEFTKAIKIRMRIKLPPDPEAYTGLGRALNGQQRYREAEVFFREALRLNPRYALAHHHLAVALWSQGKYSEAERAYRDALRLNPEDKEAKKMLPQVMTWEGHRLVQAGKEAEAKEAYRRALAEFPGHAEAREALSTLERKPVSTTPQDPRAAEAEHREQIRSDPQNPKHYNNLGVALYQQGKLGQAEAAYREAIRLNPGAPVVWGNLGLVLEQQGRHDEAVEAYRQAAKLDPSNMAVRERLQRLEKGRIEAGSPTPSSQPAGIGGGPRRVDVEGAVQRGVRELLDKHRTPGSFNPDGSERK